MSGAAKMDYDVLVVGGGLTGTALALALSATAHRVGLLEPKPPKPPTEDWDSRIYAISPGNVAWLKALGGWAPPLRAEPVFEMRIRGDAGGRLTMDAVDAGLAELAWIAENGRLQYALWQAVRDQGRVDVIVGTAEAVAWGGQTHTLLLADGRRLCARLLVGADGAHSWLRQQAQIAVDEEDYDQSGVVANFETERPHRGIAFQWFRPDGVLAWLPLPGRRISIVWSSRNADVPERLAMPAATFASRVAEAGGHALGALRLVTPQVAFPLKRRRARVWVRPGLVLIGDAAHTVHPLAGQGVNLGFRDARLLAAMLACGGNPGEIGRLQAYAMRRVEDVASMQFATGGLKKLFNNHAPGLEWLRNTGLHITDRQEWLKQALMRHAVE
ncbi:MAG: FAD-dependent monooxygenase [Thiobacillaceae bacterium]